MQTKVLLTDHTLIETQIMSDKNVILNSVSDRAGNLFERGRHGDHLGSDTMNVGRPEVTQRIHKRLVLVNYLKLIVQQDNPNLDDSVLFPKAGGFNINNGEGRISSRHMSSLEKYSKSLTRPVSLVHLNAGVCFFEQ